MTSSQVCFGDDYIIDSSKDLHRNHYIKMERWGPQNCKNQNKFLWQARYLSCVAAWDSASVEHALQFVSSWSLRKHFHPHGKVSNLAVIVDFPEDMVLKLGFVPQRPRCDFPFLLSIPRLCCMFSDTLPRLIVSPTPAAASSVLPANFRLCCSSFHTVTILGLKFLPLLTAARRSLSFPLHLQPLFLLWCMTFGFDTSLVLSSTGFFVGPR